MSTIFSLILGNYKNLLVFMLIPSVSVAATITMIELVFYKDNDFINNINVQNSNIAFAQQIKTTTPALSTNKITIGFISSQFVPLTNSTFNQLKININYKTNDASLVNTKINGIMKVFSLNGTTIKTSSFPRGFLLNQTGTIQFASSFTDKTVQTVKANIALTDLNKINPLSNNVTRNVTFSIIK